MNPELMEMLQAQGIDPSQLAPEQLQQLEEQFAGMQQNQIPQEGMIGAENVLPSSPEGEPFDTGMDHMSALQEMIMQYIDYANGVKNDTTLGHPVKAQIMVQMAQAVNYLVPLIPNDQDMQMKQAELQMKFEEQQANLQFKQQEMQMNLEMKQQEMQMKAQENQMKQQQQQEQHHQKMQQQEQNNQLSLVQSQQQHEVSMEQTKQAAQLKQSQSKGNDKGKKE